MPGGFFLPQDTFYSISNLTNFKNCWRAKGKIWKFRLIQALKNLRLLLVTPMVQWNMTVTGPLGPFWRYPILHWIMEYQSMVKVGRKGGWLIILRVFPNSNHQSEGLWVVFSSLQYAWLISQTYLAQVGKHAHLFFETPVSKNIDLTIGWRVENFLRIKFEHPQLQARLDLFTGVQSCHTLPPQKARGFPTLGKCGFPGWLVGWLVGRVSAAKQKLVGGFNPFEKY